MKLNSLDAGFRARVEALRKKELNTIRRALTLNAYNQVWVVVVVVVVVVAVVVGGGGGSQVTLWMEVCRKGIEGSGVTWLPANAWQVRMMVLTNRRRYCWGAMALRRLRSLTTKQQLVSSTPRFGFLATDVFADAAWRSRALFFSASPVRAFQPCCPLALPLLDSNAATAVAAPAGDDDHNTLRR